MMSERIEDPITGRAMPVVELIARMIARGLGHNDDVGMFWERYVAPAAIIFRELPAALQQQHPQAPAGGEWATLYLAVCEVRDAIAFMDRVKASTEAEKIAVGTDHWDRLERAARRLAPPLTTAEMEEQMRQPIAGDAQGLKCDGEQYVDYPPESWTAQLVALRIAHAQGMEEALEIASRVLDSRDFAGDARIACIMTAIRAAIPRRSEQEGKGWSHAIKMAAARHVLNNAVIPPADDEEPSR